MILIYFPQMAEIMTEILNQDGFDPEGHQQPKILELINVEMAQLL
jgi:hypothetical protein